MSRNQVGGIRAEYRHRPSSRNGAGRRILQGPGHRARPCRSETGLDGSIRTIACASGSWFARKRAGNRWYRWR